MRGGVRFYKSKRWCSACQTEIEVDLQHCEEDIGLVPMGFDFLKGWIIPPQRARTVEPGNLYIRCRKGGKELVRKRQHKCKCEDTMCNKCHHGHDSRRGEEPVLARKKTVLVERRRCLEAELARAEEREIRERIGIRDRRPYHISSERKDSTPPPETAAAIDAERTYRRRMRFATDEPIPFLHRVHGHCKRQQQQQQQQQQQHQHYHHHHRRRSSQHDVPPEHRGYVQPSPRSEYYVHEIEPATSYRRHGRPSSRIISNKIYHNDIPIFCSRIVTGGRRKSSSGGGCRRASRRYSYYYPHVQFESRDPEDYYY